MLPPLTGILVNLIKHSAILSFVAVFELTTEARNLIADTFMSFEIWMLVGGMYLVMTITLSTLVGFLNVVSGALDKMDQTKNQLKWGPMDIVVIGLLVSSCVYVFHRVDTVLIYEWDWSVIPGYLFRWDEEANKFLPNLLMKGLVTTLRISFWALILSSIVGVFLALREQANVFSPDDWLDVCRVHSQYSAGSIFIFILFFISSQVIPHLGLRENVDALAPQTKFLVETLFGPSNLIENFLSGVLSLALMSAAYIAEIVRAGIQSIPKGQIEAGRTIGLSSVQIMRYVVLPQAIQKVIPRWLVNLSLLIKDSSSGGSNLNTRTFLQRWK